MTPLVSILIPAYNAERWIAETIRSALRQTWPNKEIIVVDDGSADGTLTVVRQFESNEVRVVTQPNQGAAAARNRAFSLRQGHYIQWLDAEDLLSPCKVAHQMQRAGQTRDGRMLFLVHGRIFGFDQPMESLFRLSSGPTLLRPSG